MAGAHFNCSELNCTCKVVEYRQCSLVACNFEIGYCKDHGDRDRALGEMIEHIKEHLK